MTIRTPVINRRHELEKSYRYTHGRTHRLSFAAYIDLNYSGYKAICNRCGVKPLTRKKWLAVAPF